MKLTEDERERKVESRVEGNHVRKVVKPMEDRINAKMEKMEAEPVRDTELSLLPPGYVATCETNAPS